MDRSRNSRISTVVEPLRNPWFIAGAGLFVVHFQLQQSGMFFPIADSYLDDLLCLPILLTLSLAGMRVVHPSYQLSIFQILAAVVYCSFLFELILPIASSQYSADPFDAACYALGAGFYMLFMKGKT